MRQIIIRKPTYERVDLCNLDYRTPPGGPPIWVANVLSLIEELDPTCDVEIIVQKHQPRKGSP